MLLQLINFFFLFGCLKLHNLKLCISCSVYVKLGGSTLVTLPHTVTPKRDSVDGTVTA